MLEFILEPLDANKNITVKNNLPVSMIVKIILGTLRTGHIHETLLLDRTVCLPLYTMWPSFGYFSTVI